MPDDVERHSALQNRSCESASQNLLPVVGALSQPLIMQWESQSRKSSSKYSKYLAAGGWFHSLGPSIARRTIFDHFWSMWRLQGLGRSGRRHSHSLAPQAHAASPPRRDPLPMELCFRHCTVEPLSQELQRYASEAANSAIGAPDGIDFRHMAAPRPPRAMSRSLPQGRSIGFGHYSHGDLSELSLPRFLCSTSTRPINSLVSHPLQPP